MGWIIPFTPIKKITSITSTPLYQIHQIYLIDNMQDVVRVTKNGTSLAINVTKLCNEAGIEAGDYVAIDMRKIDISMRKPVGIEETRDTIRKVLLTEGQKWGLVGPEICWYAEDVYGKVPREETTFVLRQLLEEGAIYVAEMGQYRMDPNNDFWKGEYVAPHNNRELSESERIFQSRQFEYKD